MANKFDKIKNAQLQGGLLDTDGVPGQMTMPEDYPETAPETEREPAPKPVKSTPKKKSIEPEKSEHKLATFYLSEEDLKLYKRYAQATGVTLSKLIGTAVKQYVNKGITRMDARQKTIFDALKE